LYWISKVKRKTHRRFLSASLKATRVFSPYLVSLHLVPVTLNDYINSFQRLHVSRSQGVAPHKPVLLISVLDEIESGRIIENKICITPERQ